MLTVKQVASQLSLSEAAIYRFIAKGDLECHRFGNAIRVTESQLAEFVENKRKASEASPFRRTLKHI